MASHPINELHDRDHVERERSAAEASKTVLSPVQVDRYLTPASNTPHYLEYSFHLLGDVHGKTVLDLGCGSGETIIPLVKRGAIVIGIDISPDLIDIARRRANSYGVNPNLEVGSAYETGLHTESVDVVFSMAVLHHLDLPRARAVEYCVLAVNLSSANPFAFHQSWTEHGKYFPHRQRISRSSSTR